MTSVATGSQEGLEALCRRFGEVTGVPLRSATVEADEAVLVEAQLHNDPDCLWFRRMADGPGKPALVSLHREDLPDDRRTAFTVTDLAEIVSEMFTTFSTVRQSLASRMEGLSALVSAGLSAPREEELLDALRQLLRVAVQLVGFHAAGFFLLNPRTGRLNLRAATGVSPDRIPQPCRDPQDGPPDLQALAYGRAVLHRPGRTDRSHWLPEGESTGCCLAVRSEAGPLGTLWVFDRGGRSPGEEDIRLLRSIADQMAAVLERVVHRREGLQRERMQRDLRLAAESQCGAISDRSVLPKGTDAAWLCTSRYELGGDLCELIPLDVHRSVVAVGDACGESLPAAIVMSALRGAVQALSMSSVEEVVQTDRLVQRLNQALCRVTPPHQFMSLLFGVLDTEAKTLTYTNAGHPRPVWRRAGETAFLESHGMLLGVLEESDYGRSVIELNAGELLVFFSDGISEATGRDGTLFGREGIAEAVGDLDEASAREVFETLWSRMEAHTGGASAADDRTLLVIRM